MRVVFMGTPAFARKSLEKLYSDGFEVAAVFTQPDKPKDRGMKLGYSPVKELAVERGTPVFQPLSLKDGTAVRIIGDIRCELLVVVAYGRILPAQLLDLPPMGCINIHASLLPKYRGAAPIQWAVLNGEKETGVTSQYVAEKIDSGDIILAAKTPIGDEETAGELYDRLSLSAAELLGKTLDVISRGQVVRIPQNHDEATYAPPLSKEMSPIDWSQTARMIKCKVRGLNPWPVASTVLNDTLLKVFTVSTNNGLSGKEPGQIVSAGKHGIEISCADGTVTIMELQLPGGKRMAASEYLRGHTLL